MAFRWTSTTAPFTDLDGQEPARFVLEQVADDGFALREPFRWAPTEGEQVIVCAERLGTTDLASILSSLTWFVNRHGRHTPAALVHDQLVRQARSTEERLDADDRFRRAMTDLDVPPVRALVMWSAVVAATRWTAGGRRRVGMALWTAAAVAGTATLAHGIVRRRPRQVLIALVGPVAAAPLWGRQAPAAVIGGYAIWLVVVPTATSLVGYGAYWVLEEGVRLVRLAVRTRHDPVPAPPVPFTETT